MLYSSFHVLPTGPRIFSLLVLLSKNPLRTTIGNPPREAPLTENRAGEAGLGRLAEETRRHSGGSAGGCGLSLLNWCCWHRVGADWELPAGEREH